MLWKKCCLLNGMLLLCTSSISFHLLKIAVIYFPSALWIILSESFLLLHFLCQKTWYNCWMFHLLLGNKHRQTEESHFLNHWISYVPWLTECLMKCVEREQKRNGSTDQPLGLYLDCTEGHSTLRNISEKSRWVKTQKATKPMHIHCVYLIPTPPECCAGWRQGTALASL